MKKFYPFFMYLLAVLTTSAQCTIDSSNIPVPGVYPQPSNLPHIQQSTFYDQTIQGRVKPEGDTLILGATFHYTVEFMRVDSITGLPPGISWAKSPTAIPGGGVGCLRFYGTTNAAAGTYPLVFWESTRMHLSSAQLPIMLDTTWSTNTSQYSPFGGYYLVVDPAGSLLTVSLIATDVACAGLNNGSVTAIPANGNNYSYMWSNGESTQTISNLPGGTYTVTVTSGASTVTGSATVNEPSPLTLNISTTPAAGGNDGTASVTVTGGTSPYTYLWINNQTTNTITNLTPGSYDVLVTDSRNCTATNTATVDGGPTPVTTNPKISAGEYFSLKVCDNGTVRSAGNGDLGQLGDGTYGTAYTPVAVSGLNNVISVNCGRYHALAVKSDNTLWAWGGGGTGQLGNGQNGTNSNVPVQVNFGGTEIIAASAGHGHSLALSSTGQVYAWGWGWYGQIGGGNDNDVSVPSFVPGLPAIAAISANSSYYHSLALDATGNVWAWGGNAQGQLGNGTNTYSNTVVSVTGLGGVTAICTGYRMSMALKSDGTVWTWGENTHGQLGDGSTTDRNLPVQVMGLSGIVAIAAGNIHCLALKNDGTVWAWGFNDQGELGNGSTAESHVPVQVTGLAGQNVTYIEAGARQSFAVTSSGNVYAWGGNESGQLMNGTNTDNLTPTLVSGICGGQSAIAENEEDAAFSIYPNPVSDNITLSTLQGGPFAFELHNSAGQLLLSNKNTGNTAISMADFAPGIYFVIMKQNEKTYRKKIVKL